MIPELALQPAVNVFKSFTWTERGLLALELPSAISSSRFSPV